MSMRKRKTICILVMLALLLGLAQLPAAADAEKVRFWCTPEPVETGEDIVLGNIEAEITASDEYDYFDVTVELPDGVTYMAAATVTTATYYVREAKELLAAEADGLKIRCPGDVETIHIRFDREGSSTVKIKRGVAPPEIAVRVTVEARKGYSTRWRVTGDCVNGIAEEGRVTVTAGSPSTVTPGRERQVAAITFKEEKQGTLEEGDRIYLRLLTGGYAWEYPKDEWVTRSSYGPQVGEIRRTADGTQLALVIARESTRDDQWLKITPLVWVKDTAPAGEVKVEISSSPAVVPTTTLTVARLGSAKEVEVDVGDVPSITPGEERAATEIRFEEDAAGTLREGDRITLELTGDDVTWERPRSSWVVAGKHGLDANVDRPWNNHRLLVLTVTGESNKADTLVLKPQILVDKDADAGPVKCRVTASTAAVPEQTLTIARIGTEEEPDIGVSVRNDGDDILYRASSGTVIDTIVIKAAPALPEGKTILLTIRTRGVQWYKVEYPANLELLGFRDENQTAEFRLREDVNEVVFEGARVSVMPDAALGDVEVRVGGTAGARGTVEVGEVRSPVTATASSRKEVRLGETNQPAGDITIRETDDGAWQSGRMVLTLPEGVTFARPPEVKVNGRSVNFANPTGTGGLEFFFEATSDEDGVYIEDIRYNVGLNARHGDVEVGIDGDAVNRLDRTLYPQAFAPVVTVVNARVTGQAAPPPPPVRVAFFSIGGKVYTVNGVPYYMDVAPYIKHNRTYLPVRYVAYSLGIPEGGIRWDGRNAYLSRDGTTVVLTVGSTYMRVNGTYVKMDVPPEIVRPGRMMLPYRWVAEAFGATVSWDPATHTVRMEIAEG